MLFNPLLIIMSHQSFPKTNNKDSFNIFREMEAILSMTFFYLVGNKVTVILSISLLSFLYPLFSFDYQTTIASNKAKHHMLMIR